MSIKAGFLGEINRFLDYHLTPAVKTIFVINVVISIVMTLVGAVDPELEQLATLYLGQMPALSIGHYYLWQFLTYMFIHGGVFHLLFNMMALWFFGPELENRWGTRAFWAFYMTVGIGAGVMHAVLTLISARLGGSPYQLIIGASGAIYGVLLAYAAYWPDRTVLFYGIIPMRIKTLVIIAIIAEFYFSGSGGGGNISHLTHLTGLGIAYVYLALMHKDWDIRHWRWRYGI